MGRFSEAARVLTGGRSEAMQLAEKLVAADVTADYFKENLMRLEMSMEDEGWRRMAFNAKREFTRGGLDDIIELSRVMYLIHPLIQRSVDVTTFYTWAQGATFKANEEVVQQELVDPQMANDGNRAELYSHQARILTQVDQMCDGSVFIKLDTNPKGDVAVRSIPVEDIREIHHKPGDRQQIWFYRRKWVETVFDERSGRNKERQREVLYPDWRYHPVRKPGSIGGVEVLWDCPIMHRKTGGLKQMQFGIPSTYSSLDWARAYKKFLEDWHTLVHALSRFAWQKTVKGDKEKMKRTKEKLDSTVDENPRQRESNRGPTTGAVHISSDDEKLTPIPKSSAHTSADDAKASRLMVASGMNLPDTLLSNDPQQGALATAKTLDRPTELYMRNWQALESDWHGDIFRYAFDAKVRRGRSDWGRIENDYDGCTLVVPSVDPTVTLSFPPILEHDQKEIISSIVAAATLEGKQDAGTIPRELLSHKLMENLGVEDIEQALGELDTEEARDLKETVETLREAAKMFQGRQNA